MRLTEASLVVASLLFTPTLVQTAGAQGLGASMAVADDPQASAGAQASRVTSADTPAATDVVQEPTTAAPGAPAPATRRWGFRTLFRDVGSDFAHVPSRGSFAVAAIGGAVALAAHPLDDDVNRRLQGTSFFGAGDRLGSTFTMMGATFAVYGVGLAAGHDRVTHVALDLVRAQVVSEVLVQSLKRTVRRERPDGSNRLSFPSGHAAVTFATATVLERHHGLAWALPAYGLATYVATSRLHDNVHYLSDVVFGAAVGILAGRTVTRHGASTFSVAPMVAPGGAGVFLVRSPRS